MNQSGRKAPEQREATMKSSTTNQQWHPARAGFRLIALTAVLGCLLLQTPSALANGNLNPGIAPANSDPHGKSYSQWAAAWWQWALSIPVAQNPLADETGANAAVGQSGPVWFLGGATSGATLTRTVTIPAGKALFFPVVNTLWTTLPSDPPITEAEIRDILNAVTSDATGLTCEIDGIAVDNLADYIHQSPVFWVTVSADNLFGFPPGTYPNIDEGCYLMLAPLPVGGHVIHFASNNVDLGAALDITYRVNVSAGK